MSSPVISKAYSLLLVQSTFRTYRPALARHILRKTPKARFFGSLGAESTTSPSSSAPLFDTTPIHTPRPKTTTTDASLHLPHEAHPRPYSFHIGASWAGKPEHMAIMHKVPFPADTLVGSWRDKTLSRKSKTVRSVDAGEDFFFVQEVSWRSLNFVTVGSS